MSTSRRSTKKIRLAQRRRKLYFIYFIAFSSVLVLAYVGIGFLLMRGDLSIKHINITGNNIVSERQLTASVMYDLARVKWLLMSEDTIFTYDKNYIQQDLLNKYPDIERVEMSTSGVDTLNINIKERDVVAQWCGNVCYLLDKNGSFFRKEEQPLSGYIIYKGELREVGYKQTLLKEGFADLHSFVLSLNSLGTKVKEVHIYEDDVEIFLDNLPIIKVNVVDDFKKILSYIKLTLKSDDFKKVFNSEGGVEYIDLRFGNKIYYK